MGRIHLHLILVFGLTHLEAKTETCQSIYEGLFEAFDGKVKPNAVGDLYKGYCKKNMKSSSAKSMDVLCQPLVEKVEEKMRWVPPDHDVTADLVCLSLDKIKAEFPEYAEKAVALQKQQENTEAGLKKKNVETGKKLSAEIQKEIKEAIGSHKTALVKELGEKMKAKVDKVLGEDAVPEAVTKMLKWITDQADLNLKGVETKLLQTTEKAVGGWIQDTAKAQAAKAKKAEL